MKRLTLWKDNDCVLELDALMTSTTSTYQNSGMGVVATLYTTTGSEVAGQTWPAALSYVASSNGTYRANLSSSLQATIGTECKAVITATASTTGIKATFVRWVDVKDRTN